MAEANTLRAALRHLPDGSRRAVYLVEEPNGGLCTILVPHAPAAMSGPVELVPRDSLSKLDRGLGSFMQALNHWGTGLAQLPEVSGLEVTSRRKEP
jgi:uncharacterized membrane protein